MQVWNTPHLLLPQQVRKPDVGGLPRRNRHHVFLRRPTVKSVLLNSILKIGLFYLLQF